MRIPKPILCLLFSALLCAAGCSYMPETAAPVPETEASTMQATPQPTPITVAGSIVTDGGALRAVVQESDFAQIEKILGLRVLDVSGSDCYEAILAYCAAHPDVDVRYTVPIGEDAVLSNKETSAEVQCLSDASLLRYLPALKSLTVTEPLSCEQAAALLAAAVDADLCYSVSFAGLTVASDTTDLDLSDVSPALKAPIAEGLSVLPKLMRVELARADGSSDWTLSDAGVLQAVRPALSVHLNVTAFGVSFSLTDDVVSFSGKHLAERVEEVEALLPYLRNVGRLDMENCFLPDETMADLRARFPSPKIVWRVRVGEYECRTDAVMIRFSNLERYKMLTDKDVHALIYCNEVRYLDLGHNEIQDPYFVAYMPNLEVCVLAIHQPTDISAFANCTHLEYAELFNGNITDVSPLRHCTELRHLNLCMNRITDIIPLFSLTKLERLWISKNPIPKAQLDAFQRMFPNCVVNTTAKDPTLNEWRWDYSRPSHYSKRYELLREQFRYDKPRLTYYIEGQVID